MRSPHAGDLGAQQRTAFVLCVALVAAVVLGDGGPARGADDDGRANVQEAAEQTTDLEVRLSTEGPTVADMVDTVRRHARRTPGADADAAVTLVLTCDLAAELDDTRPYLAGQQRGRFAYARVDLTWPEAVLIHEVAHVVTAGDGHGPIWRAVYLGAIAELYGDDRATREHRRIAWVHDRCYTTDSCPRIR